MDQSAEEAAHRVRAGLAVLTASSIVQSVSVEIRDGVIAGWETVPESSLSPAERATILTPGLVNAHTHLDLGALRGAVSGSSGFLPWVQGLVEAREELHPEQMARGIRESAWEALRTGSTSVIDIDSVGATVDALRATRGDTPNAKGPRSPRTLLLREVLDGSPQGRTARTASALELARAAAMGGHGISPHATHTVGDALLEGIRDLACAPPHGSVPVGTHWAETAEETQWLLDGKGPFASWLGPSPGLSGTERLAKAGLLDGALLFHGNDPQPGEPERIAAAGGTLVHCPGCHLFFGREPFQADRYLAAGVRLALGTDSWASNESLDMRREMRLASTTLGLEPSTIWRMATEHGALCIPDVAVTGTIAEGSAADLVAFVQPVERELGDLGALASTALQTLTQTEPSIRGVWVAGRAIALD